jgi:hypothetical protein
MFEELSPNRLVSHITQSFDRFCDVRKGQNSQFGMLDARMGAFSVSLPKVHPFWDTNKT